jgi:hypothetical protein
MDIQMNRDGSGRLTMEYGYSRTLGGLGGLDGNENWPVIPIGRADWERSIKRIQGARLASFSTSERGQDTITTVILEYDSIETLLKIIDQNNERTSASVGDNQNRFEVILGSSDDQEINDELLDLIQEIFTGYTFSISFSAASNSTLTVTDGKGNTIAAPASAQIVSSGRRVSFLIDMMELIGMSNDLGISFSW